MNIKKLAAEVARESKACRLERGGIAISIWPEGDYSTAVWRGNSTDRNDATGKPRPRLLCIDWPVTAATAEEMIREAFARRLGAQALGRKGGLVKNSGKGMGSATPEERAARSEKMVKARKASGSAVVGPLPLR